MTYTYKVTRWPTYDDNGHRAGYLTPHLHPADGHGCWLLEVFKGPNPRRDGVYADLCRNPRTAAHRGRTIAAWYAKQPRGVWRSYEQCRKLRLRWPFQDRG